jgi:hypothetical protein
MDDLNKLEESILSIADGIPDTVVDTPSLQIDRLPGRLHSKGHLGAVKKLGYRADVAPSGLAALEALDRTYYVTTV